ncbi:hypothetical protein COU54_05835 [Candidatus Pacearchaeota archaeon CG10_big_fil_rev_8_21_14_0_10_31_24]|nr:MAG: hypothetical protein COU54_05835 [Candidatus Pacearchaeota archaeon CG10_big_fil_rev_8_21_14_0_10_31_24]
MAKSKNGGNLIGSWAFLIGFILAIVLGAMNNVTSTMTAVLVIVGIVVGLLNVADKEVAPFLMSGVTLIIAGALGGNALSTIPQLVSILNALLAIFIPATILVAIKNVFALARN